MRVECVVEPLSGMTARDILFLLSIPYDNNGLTEYSTTPTGFQFMEYKNEWWIIAWDGGVAPTNGEVVDAIEAYIHEVDEGAGE